MAASRDWTLAEALAAQEQFRAAGGQLSDPAAPFSQWVALKRLDQLEQAFRDGEESALLAAVAECARADLVMPLWLATAFLHAYRDVIHRRAVSWDDVFGSPLPGDIKHKLQRLVALRKKREKSLFVWEEVRRRSAPRGWDQKKGEAGEAIKGEAIDDLLFDSVGKKFGIGRTIAKEYYGFWKDQFDCLEAGDSASDIVMRELLDPYRVDKASSEPGKQPNKGRRAP